MDELIHILRDALGPEKAVTLDRMAELLGMTRRMVEQLIEDHLRDLPFAVVAGGGGYYRPTAPAHLNAYLHNLHSRHRRMQIREAIVRRKARAEGWAEEAGGFVRQPAQLDLFAAAR